MGKGKNELSPFRYQNESKIKELYDRYKIIFLGYARRNFSVNLMILEDIYHESFIDLCENIREGKLCQLSASLQTYLFKIGTNKILNYLRTYDRYQQVDITDVVQEVEKKFESGKSQRIQEITYQTVLTMQEPCNRLLILYYWGREKMVEIAQILNYKTEQVAKNKKHWCIKMLKDTLIEKLKEEDLIV